MLIKIRPKVRNFSGSSSREQDLFENNPSNLLFPAQYTTGEFLIAESVSSFAPHLFCALRASCIDFRIKVADQGATAIAAGSPFSELGFSGLR